MITNRDIHVFSRTLAQASKLKKFYGDSRIVLASIARKNRIVCYGSNSYEKSHPYTIQTKPNVIITKHAEVDAVSTFENYCSNKNIGDYTMYIVSLSFAKEPKLSWCSKPCNSCMPFLEQSGVKRIIYHEKSANTFSLKEILIDN